MVFSDFLKKWKYFLNIIQGVQSSKCFYVNAVQVRVPSELQYNRVFLNNTNLTFLAFLYWIIIIFWAHSRNLIGQFDGE